MAVRKSPEGYVFVFGKDCGEDNEKGIEPHWYVKPGLLYLYFFKTKADTEADYGQGCSYYNPQAFVVGKKVGIF